jgi:flavin-dependent dehydrogenase
MKRYDAAVVGASLAGCTAAILLARSGARVALVDKSEDPASFKRICSHYIQPEGVPTLERLGLMGPILAAGGLLSPLQVRTPEGLIEPPVERAGLGVNLRRERLDPLVREAAAAAPGVELMLGWSAQRLLREGGAVAGVAVRDRAGAELSLRAPLTVGADGRDSRVAELAGAEVRTRPHGRFVYAGYYEGAYPEGDARARVWFMDPHCAIAFPTDSGLTICGAMPTAELLPEFRPDPEAAVLDFFSGLPEAPALDPGRRAGPMLGKLEMTNRVRRRTAPGLALVGDAALASDPLFGIGCGWALRSAEWMADSVAPALAGAEPLDRGLARYRRRHRRRLGPRAFVFHDYSSGRPMTAAERGFYRVAAADPKVAGTFGAYAGGRIGPGRMLAEALPRGGYLTARDALRRLRR